MTINYCARFEFQIANKNATRPLNAKTANRAARDAEQALMQSWTRILGEVRRKYPTLKLREL